jgi:hypothetical protein
MVEVAELSRVLCGHEWRDAEEWAAAIRRLADLNDAELTELLGLCREGAHPPRNA